MQRTFRICFALWSTVLVADATAEPAQEPVALRYPQLAQKQARDLAPYHAAGLIGDQTTPIATFHDLTHQGPQPSWLEFSSSSSTTTAPSNIQRIPNLNPSRSAKPPSQQYPQSSNPSLPTGYHSPNQSIPLLDIPTNNLPIHREEVEYNPHQSGRPNLQSSTRAQGSFSTASPTVTARTPQYTLPQINSNGFYSGRNLGSNAAGRSAVPNQSFNTNSIRVQPSIYQQPPRSSDQANQFGSSTPLSNLPSSTAAPDFSQFSGPASQAPDASQGSFQPAGRFGNQPQSGTSETGAAGSYPRISDENQRRLGNGYSQTTSRGFGSQPGASGLSRAGETGSYPQPGKSNPRFGGGYSQTAASNGFGNQPGPQTGDPSSNRFGDQSGSYPQISVQNQPRPGSGYSPAAPGYSGNGFGNQPKGNAGDHDGSYFPTSGQNHPESDTYPSNQFAVQELPLPPNSIPVQPIAYPQPAFQGGPLVASTPAVLVPSSTPVYFVSSTPSGFSSTTPAGPGSEQSQTPRSRLATSSFPYSGQGSSYPQSSSFGQDLNPPLGGGRAPSSDGSTAYYPPTQATTATPIVGRRGYGQPQERGPIRTTATPIVVRQYPTSTYGSQGGYAPVNSISSGDGKPVNRDRGQTKFSTLSPTGESENYPANFSPSTTSRAFPSVNRGQVKFSSGADPSTVASPPTSTSRALSSSSPDRPDTHHQVSNTIPPFNFGLPSSAVPGVRQSSGRSNFDFSRAQYSPPVSPPSSGASYPGDAGFPSPSPPIVSSTALPPQPSEPSYPQPGPPYQQPPSIAAQYNPNVPKSIAPAAQPYPSSRGLPPSPSYSTSQVFGSSPVLGSGSSTAAPSIYDYSHNPFLQHLIPGSNAPSFLQSSPAFSTVTPLQRRNDVINQGSATATSAYGNTPTSAAGQTAVSCPERTGRFADPIQCDAYVECVEGNGVQKLCPDGLLFNPKAYFTYPCQYPAEVDCGSRSGVQAAQATVACPHQFGYYRLGDRAQCSTYMNCANGVGHIQTCPEGLAFNELTIRCDWPDEVPSCDAESFLGFTCPQPSGNSQDADKPPNFPHPTEPTKYFSCQNGRPRLHTCPGPFNPSMSLCQGAENGGQPENSNYDAGSNLQFAPQPPRVGY